jgi:hypothetical protein
VIKDNLVKKVRLAKKVSLETKELKENRASTVYRA